MGKPLRIVIAGLVFGVPLIAGPAAVAAQEARRSVDPAASYESTLREIARSIEALKAEFPQLAEFSASTNSRVGDLTITYGYRTQDPPKTGGWTSGVPNPTADGVWFSLSIYDPDSTLEMHTQPVVPRYRLRDKRVQLLLLEGAGTKSLRGELHRILVGHGVRPERPGE